MFGRLLLDYISSSNTSIVCRQNIKLYPASRPAFGPLESHNKSQSVKLTDTLDSSAYVRYFMFCNRCAMSIQFALIGCRLAFPIWARLWCKFTLSRIKVELNLSGQLLSRPKMCRPALGRAREEASRGAGAFHMGQLNKLNFL